ncbi:MAG: acyltransferase, partial [Fibrobacteres bacterium]|nr:acyltransferase [Fibrobacterota bacterium]
MHNNLNKYVRLEYRPEIDGLRALAILSVILFHFGRKLLSGGFLGVDVFFVISGFLITSLLLKDSDDGWSSLKRFWLRRVKRITPALITMVGITLVVTLFLLPKWEHGLKGWHGFSSLLSFANITMWRMDDNYWGPQAAQSLFLHCWSLSIEEQFYILFPFLVMFCKRKGNLLFYLICAIIFVSLALFIYSTQFHYRAAFYLLPMRAWELAVGSLVAIFVAHRVDPQL